MVIHEKTSPYLNERFSLNYKNSKFVNNHVSNTFEQNQAENNNMGSSDGEKDKSKKMSVKKNKKRSFTSNLEVVDDAEVTQINDKDLEELRTVYKKCKAVIKKIESKYGHLLNLQESEGQRTNANASDSENGDDKVCKCPVKKKIVFDEDGQVISSEADLGNHICVKKLKKVHSTSHSNVNHIQIEYETNEVPLPDDLVELENILHNPVIDPSYRKAVIQKMKRLRQEYTDEVRFNKPLLIEKLKLNPEDVLDFKGTNLKSLPGYKIS